VGSLDTITWQALTVALTLVGLVTTGLVWRRRGAVAGLRMLALSLLPAAAYLTGTLRLVWEIADAVVSWALRLTFSPSVWLGLVLAGVAVTLLVVTSALRRRGAGRSHPPRGDDGTPAVGGEPERAAVRRSARPAVGDEDLADIEAILKKHGIS
jgi:hypothetical protein